MTGMVAMAAEMALVAVLADAAACDLRARHIPNRDPALAALAFLAAAAFTFEPGALLLHLAAGAALLALGAALFARGLWGGGDAKLAAALGLWTGFAGMPRFLMVMALAGGVLALAVLALRRPAAPAANPQAVHLPYGVAIAAAGIDWVARTGFSG